MKKKVSPNNPAENPVLDELPDFSFLGTDGEVYYLSKTPHEFVTLLKNTGINQAQFTYETLDQWIWLHVKAVPAQKQLTLDDTGKLYFQCDIPHIVDCIFRRLDDCKYSIGDALKIAMEHMGKMMEAVNATEEDGSLRPAGERRPQQKRK